MKILKLTLDGNLTIHTIKKQHVDISNLLGEYIYGQIPIGDNLYLIYDDAFGFDLSEEDLAPFINHYAEELCGYKCCRDALIVKYNNHRMVNVTEEDIKKIKFKLNI